MSGDLVLRFRVEAYTPQTIPMSRLAEYLEELAKLLGERQSVHFVRLDEGSTDIVHRVEREAAPKALARAEAVRAGTAPVDAVRAYHRLNHMLGADNGSGRLTEEDGAQIIDFPGVRRPATEYGMINQRGSIDGQLIRIGGKKDKVPLTLQRGAIDYTGVFASRPKAEELGKVLFRPIRLFGDGRWFRTAQGAWELDHFDVDSFKVLNPEPLSRAVADLRALAADGWSGDAYEELDELRRGDLH